MAGHLTARKKQALEMKARIQSVALDLFDREGFENVSVEEIAKEVGCSVGNIYHYFKGKDELAIQTTSHVDAAYLELREQYQADHQRSAREKLLDFVGQALEISAGEEVLYKTFIYALKYPEKGVLKFNPDRVYFRLLEELICACQEEGSISPSYSSKDILEYLVVLHRGMLFEWKINECAFSLTDRGTQMADAFLRGLQA